MDDFSVESARAAGQRGEMAAWVAEFLSSPGSDNPVLAEALAEGKAAWCGPVRLRFDDLQRLAGPPDQPALAPLDEDDIETVEEMDDSIDEGWEPPPLIVSFSGDTGLYVEDGNHRIETLRRCGQSDYWALVCFDDDEQRRAFEATRDDLTGSR